MWSKIKEDIYLANGRLNHHAVNRLTLKERKYINDNTKFLNNYLSKNKSKQKIKDPFQIRLFCLDNNLTNIPKCQYCKNKQVLFQRDYKSGFKKTCSKSCTSKFNNESKDIFVENITYMTAIEMKHYFLKKVKKEKRFKFIQKTIEDNSFIETLRLLGSNDKSFSDNELLYIYSENIEELTISENIKQTFEEKKEEVKCRVCGSKVTFYDFSRGFSTFCSSKCVMLDDESKKKIKNTLQERYGVDNPMKSQEFKEKLSNTMLSRYGERHSLNIKEFKEKFIKTSIKKYKVNHPMKSKLIKNKLKQKILRKYNVESPMKNLTIKKRKDETMLKKYGVLYPYQNEEIKKKTKKTYFKKNGINYFHQSHITNFDKYNDKEFIQNTFVKNGVLDVQAIISFFNVKDTAVYRLIKNLGITYERTQYNKSKAEIELYKHLKNKSDKIKLNDKSHISPYELDLYIEKDKKRIGIEYNGLMYHSFGVSKYSMLNNAEKEKQVIPMEKYPGLRSIYKNKSKHLLKTDLSEAKDIKLFHINENEWIDPIKRKIWESMLSYEVGEAKIKMGKRNFYLKDITPYKDLVRSFLDHNHIQGKINSKVALGLFSKKSKTNFNKFKWSKEKSYHIDNIFYKLDNSILYYLKQDTLVSLMTFGHPRFNKAYKWELLRFCSMKNSSIYQAGSILLEYFKEKYMKKGDSLLSYGNRRWTNRFNNFYEHNGFNLVKISEPNYYYFHVDEPYKLYHRMVFQKGKLKEYFEKNLYDITYFNPKLGAVENVMLNGYRRIWDSGNLVYELSV